MTDEDTYVLRELSGVMEIERLLEAALKRPNPAWCEEREDAEKLADGVSKQLFGITAAETRHINNPYHSREWNEEHWAETEPYIRRGPPTNGDPAAIIEGFDDYGWDVTDGAGAVLRCLTLFSRQIVLASKGIRGRLPDEGLSEEEEEGIEARLRAEAAKFKHGR